MAQTGNKHLRKWNYQDPGAYQTIAYTASILFLLNLAVFLFFFRGSAPSLEGGFIDAEIRAFSYLAVILVLSFFVYSGHYNFLKIMIGVLVLVFIASLLLLDIFPLAISFILLALIYFSWEKVKPRPHEELREKETSI